MIQWKREVGQVALGALLFALGSSGCGRSEATSEVRTKSVIPEAATLARSLGSVGSVCAELRVGGAGKTICEPKGTDPGQVLEELEDARPGVCELLFPPENPTARNLCMNAVPRVYAEGGTGSDPGTWLASVNDIQSYFRMSPGASMDIYEDSLWRMEQIAKDIVGPSADALANKRKKLKETRSRLGDKLKARAEADRGAVSTEMANRRQKFEAFQREFDAYKAEVQGLETEFSACLNEFVKYRSEEAAVFAHIKDIAQRASTVELNGIGQLQLELVTLSRAESARPQSLQMNAQRLIHEMVYIKQAHLADLAEHAEFLQQNNIQIPELTQHSSEVLKGIVGYADARYERIASAVKKLLQGLQLRREALVSSQADETTRQALANAATLKASEDFLTDATARTQALWALPPRSTRLKLFFLAQKHVDFESILQLEPLCANVSASATPWMDSGCVALRRQFSSARSYLTTTLPNTVRMNVASMRRAGVSENLLKDVEAHLAASNLRQAVIAHDVALRASDL